MLDVGWKLMLWMLFLLMILFFLFGLLSDIRNSSRMWGQYFALFNHSYKEMRSSRYKMWPTQVEGKLGKCPGEHIVILPLYVWNHSLYIYNVPIAINTPGSPDFPFRRSSIYYHHCVGWNSGRGGEETDLLARSSDPPWTRWAWNPHRVEDPMSVDK